MQKKHCLVFAVRCGVMSRSGDDRSFDWMNAPASSDLVAYYDVGESNCAVVHM